MKFQLGRVVATPGALEAAGSEHIARCLVRHVSGDWGDIDPEDAGLNEQALEHGDRIMSVYPLRAGNADAAASAVRAELVEREQLWIITEADRSSTTILLPDEY